MTRDSASATSGRVSPTSSVIPEELRQVERQYHFMFNRLSEVNEQLVKGREEVFFGHQFAVKGSTPTALPASSVEVYLQALRGPGALHACFQCYRAIETTVAQNRKRAQIKLSIPVLAIEGGSVYGDAVVNTVREVADDVTGVTIPDCGHYVPEEAPERLLAALEDFLV